MNLSKLEEAMKYKEKGGLNSPLTIKSYTDMAERLLRLTPDKPLRCKCQANWIRAQTVIKRLRAFGVVDNDHDFPVTADFVPPEPGEFEDKVLTPEQFVTLLDYLPRSKRGAELRLACKIAYFGGLRRQEVLSLTPKKIDIIPSGAIILNIKGKGGKLRKAYLPQAMREEMSNFKGFEITANYVTHTIRVTIDAIRDIDKDFPETSFHGLRHSFATLNVKDGLNIKELQKLLGHSNPVTSMIYLHAINDVPESMKKRGY